MVVLENQEIIYFDGSGEQGDNLTVSEDIPIRKNWPADIKYAVSGFVPPFIIIAGGIDSVRGHPHLI